MQVTVLEENEDGSVDVQLDDIEPRMMQLLVQEGLIAILTREVERLEKEKRVPALLKEKL